MSRLSQQSSYHYNEFVHDRHRFLERRFPEALWHGNPSMPEIALTFDDGPSQRDLGGILHTLDQHAATATFFFIGEKVPTAARLVREVAAAGHQIGIHGYRHRPFTAIKPVLLRAELKLAQILVTRICGWEPDRARDVRPPYGMFTPTTLVLLERWGYRAVMWSLVPFHWRFDSHVTIDQVRRRVQNGSLIVLHEDSIVGPSVADLLATSLPIIHDAGLQTITVDQMWQRRASSRVMHQ